MSTSFDANQYEGVYLSHKLQNWEVPKQYKGSPWFNDHYESVRPKSHQGFTDVIATDRGHINDGNQRSCKNPWGDFIGTWDLPKKIPGNRACVNTARRDASHDMLRRQATNAGEVMTGNAKNTTRQEKECDRPVDVPAAAQASRLLTAERMPSPEITRSGAAAPYPASTEPQQVSPISEKRCSRQSMQYEKINAL